jgi:hypothetical protein
VIEAGRAISMSNIWTLLVIEVMSEKAGIAKAPGKGMVDAFNDVDRDDSGIFSWRIIAFRSKFSAIDNTRVLKAKEAAL